MYTRLNEQLTVYQSLIKILSRIPYLNAKLSEMLSDIQNYALKIFAKERGTKCLSQFQKSKLSTKRKRAELNQSV